MCYDISFSTSVELITDYLPEIIIDPQIDLDFTSYEHVLAQAYRKYPIIILEDGQYKLKAFEWGVVADYMNTPEKIKAGRQWMCNAQTEKVINDKKSFWRRIRSKRCLIPLTDTLEHREIKGWKNKVPYVIRVKGRRLFCIPGLYHYTPVPGTGEAQGTFTLLTRAANRNTVMRQIHNGGTNAFRMPLFLPNQETELRWLQPELTDDDLLEIMDYEMPSEDLEYWPVFTIRSTKPRPDGGRKIDPWEWPGLPPLGEDAGAKEQQLSLL